MPPVRLRDPMRAAIWSAAGLALIGIGVSAGYPHPWLPPSASLVITLTCFVLAALCLIRAWRYWYTGAATNSGLAVSYFQFMKTREQLRKELGAANAEIERLRAELDAAKPRKLDAVKLLAAAWALRDAVGDEIKEHSIQLHAFPTVHDSSMLANQIKQALEAIGLHPRLDHWQFDRREYPLLEFGCWVIGDANRIVEQRLGAMLEGLDLPTTIIDYVQAPSYPAYDGFHIWIVVGENRKLPESETLHRAMSEYFRSTPEA